LKIIKAILFPFLFVLDELFFLLRDPRKFLIFDLAVSWIISGTFFPNYPLKLVFFIIGFVILGLIYSFTHITILTMALGGQVIMEKKQTQARRQGLID
jgi:hypothetical protein